MGNKPLQFYVNERLQKQNEKIFNLEQNLKKIGDKYNRLSKFLEYDEKKKLSVDELLSLKIKLFLRKSKRYFFRALNQKDCLKGFTTWF